jgi:hypothetical protein
MPRIHLPETVELRCTACRLPMLLESKLLSERETLSCPFCRSEFSIYEGLSGKLRRQIYHAIRDELERRVYEQHQMNRPDYFEDAQNL